jgi:predicted solute-binding protein
MERAWAALWPSRGRQEGRPASLKGIRVAIPGELTTAFLTLRLYDPFEYVVVPFDQIQRR